MRSIDHTEAREKALVGAPGPFFDEAPRRAGNGVRQSYPDLQSALLKRALSGLS